MEMCGFSAEFVCAASRSMLRYVAPHRQLRYKIYSAILRPTRRLAAGLACADKAIFLRGDVMKVMHRRTAQFLRVFGVGLALASLGPFANAQSRPNPPNPLSIVGGSTVPDGSSATFFDNFEYAVGRSD